MKVKSIAAATLLVASTAWTPASAADLGGDCCADLEERVAELEATTARKGNRKVSLTVSGQVNELVYWWDDGHESNVYVGTSGFSSSRFRFVGDAKISADWSAGYIMEIEVVSAQVNKTDDRCDDGNSKLSEDDCKSSASGIKVRHSAWYLNSKTLGRITVGQTSFSADDITSGYSLGGTATATQGNIDAAPGMSLLFNRTTPNGIKASDVFQVGDVDRGNIIRYDTPVFAGFTASVSWGEDDMWSAALRYAGEFGGFKFAAAVGYFEDNDANGQNGDKTKGQWSGYDYDEIRAGASLLHVPTGLFVDGGYMHREFDRNNFGDVDYWYVRGGIYQKFVSLGKTSLFGEYGHIEGAERDSTGTADDMTDSEGTYYGIGVQQEIDAAAMEIYLGWRHFDADADDVNGRAFRTEDIETVYTGARIKF